MVAVVRVNVPSASLCRLCSEEEEEGVREVGVAEMESSKLTRGGLRDEVSDQWGCQDWSTII